MATRTLLALALTLAISSGCGRQNEAGRTQVATTQTAAAQPAPAPVLAAVQPLEQRLGWVDDSCLAIANKALAADTPVVVVSLDEKVATLVDGRVVAATASPAICPALRDERRSANVGAGLSFYQLTLPKKVNSGVGLIGVASRVGGGIDVDGDGRPDAFTQCVTSEGVSYRVWRDAPYQGKPLWSGYSYLGYDTESNCPPS